MTQTSLNEKQQLYADLIAGLQQPQKRLPAKYFYDERGSALFEEICELEEYYPTRTEISIIMQNIDEMAGLVGAETLLIEYGSGSSIKIRLLLEHLDQLAAYVPIDISKAHLMDAAATLSRDYPRLRIIPLHADYTADFSLPEFHFPYSHKVVFFPGSTIGNFTPSEARTFLQHVAGVTGRKGGLLIGVDLRKESKILERAYNDGKGVTAEFNLNMLIRLNNEFGADFDLDNFRHKAVFNEEHGRIEMHLVSLLDQRVTLGDIELEFREGETILTEYSYKYTCREFRDLAAGLFHVEHVWTDPDKLFSIQYLVVDFGQD